MLSNLFLAKQWYSPFPEATHEGWAFLATGDR